jgi:hypothetical protein
MNRMKALIVVLLLALTTVGVWAQDDDGSTLLSPMDLMTDALPAQATLGSENFRYEAQGWNNCGPATLTMGLTYFGYTDNQNPAALWLKPNPEDKNVSPWQMVEFVHYHIPGTTRAALRYGGDLERLKTLIANDFPVLIEAGYDPPPHDLGWMGHYLLVHSYDDLAGQFTTHDSYDGANYVYSYDHIDDFWHHFNNIYIVLYDIEREAELMALLGTDADPQTNLNNTLAGNIADVEADGTDKFAWNNLGSTYAMLENYPFAASAFDQARTLDLPWRMTWYQFGMFEAYYHTGRYGDVLTLAQSNLNDGGGQYVEETYYYGGLARQGLGETARALENFNAALAFNPNFTPAREARDALLAAG